MSSSKNTTNHAAERKIDRMLKKVRSDSTWHGLRFEQCETVERWLFEENQGYEKTVERLKQEFGVETSKSSVARFFSYRARLRRATELLDAQVAADQLAAVPARKEDMREAAVKMLAQKAVVLATEKPEDVDKLMSVTKVLLDSEENDIRLRRVKLEERYYDLESNAACAKELQTVRSYLKALGENEYLDEKEKIDLVLKLLYGKDKVDVEGARELVPGADASGNNAGLNPGDTA